MKIKDKEFLVSIPEREIQDAINRLALNINTDYKDKTPLLIAILNGAFIFAADLIRGITIPSQISFIKIHSYTRMQSSGTIRELIGFNENLFKRDVIIVEDIIDSGLTLQHIFEKITSLGPSSVEVAALLLKPDAYKADIKIKYLGFEIPDQFVVGYGLDYDGLGRNLRDIHILKN